MRLVILLSALFLLQASIQAKPTFEIAGQRVTVDTDRYTVVVDGLMITEIKNKLTGEVYATPPEIQDKDALHKMFLKRGVAIESLRPAVPLKYFGLCERTKVTPERRPDGVTVTFTGLQFGSGDQAEFDDDMIVRISLSVDPKTGDLVITPSVKGNIEEVIGVRDRGILRNSFHVVGLAPSLKIIVPLLEGVGFSMENAPVHWFKEPAQFAWPRTWEAALLVAESDRGCLGIWADEPDLNYGRHLSLAPAKSSWNVGFEFETTGMIYLCDEISGASWRLNVFKGYWIQAARRYQEQMMAQWKMEPISKSLPAWADKVRVVFQYMNESPFGAGLLPRDTAMVFASQGWLKGWAEGEMQARGGDYFPNWPLDNPVRYEARDGWHEQATALEAAGLHVFPYTNATIIDPKHPWLAEKLYNRHQHSWRIWQRFYPEQCLDIVKRYGVSGIYEDCSHVLGRGKHSSPDPENWYQGSVRTREYFKQLMPEVAICGEGNNEVTARGQKFALTKARFMEQAHPIGSFLFEPFVRIWNHQQSAETLDADDIRGLISTWSGFPMQPYHYDSMILKRGLVFAREQLRSHWPDQWDPNVMHYFKGKDGSEYRFLRDHGTRFVKMLTGGGEETIFWRLHGVRTAKAPGSGIEGWIGYDGDTIVGLNPHAPMYVTSANVARPPAVIALIPENYAINRHVTHDGFWIASLGLARPASETNVKEEEHERVTQTLRVRSDRPVRFIGAESVQEIAPGDYSIKVKLPGALAAYWREPESVTSAYAFKDLMTNFTVHDRVSGSLVERFSSSKLSKLPSVKTPEQENTAAWLLQLPAEPLRLTFGYGTNHARGDGANYVVRVNGKDLWKAHRPQVDPAKPGAKVAPPVASASVDLSAFAGQTVVFELAGDGHLSGGSETRAWLQPRFEKK